uniref:Reverse transcriptase domain-containing protein n=1 Tax=Dendroctonus ponderosae TaxID=77166 RepID=A0AAR5QH77_DENPD
MSLIINENNLSGKLRYYMSHHQVEKADSTTSRTRVVFNASMQTSSGLSLNHVLKVGPVVQRDLFSILPRFRKHKFVLIGDLEKMYRQILVRPEDRGLQCIVWRDNPNSPMQHYTLNNITYGTASASFLATRCLLEIARDKESKHPLESEIIQNDFYVDDLLTGYNNIDQLIVIRKNFTNIFAEYGFRLRKFQSNSSSVLQDLQDNIGNADYTVSGETIKTLGITWNAQSDSFTYKAISSGKNKISVTKRVILSYISKQFDPLGLLSHITIRSKLIMQRLRQAKIKWDKSLLTDLHTQWLNLFN